MNGSPARPLRVLHCLDVVGGHPPQLARAERALGVAAHCVALQASPFGYAADEFLTRPGDGMLGIEWQRLKLLLRALREFDVVHFNFGSTIFPVRRDGGGLLRTILSRVYRGVLSMRDLPVLKAAGKKAFVTFQGDDARQGDYSRTHFPIHFSHEVDESYYPRGSDELKRRAIAMFGRYCDGIFALVPDLLHVLPPSAQFLPYASVDLNDWRPVPSRSLGARALRVVHAPSHRGAKGTQHLVDAVTQLRAGGTPIELILVEGLARQEARAIYETADVVVDQLLGRWYAGIGVEAMALAKPVIAYISDVDLQLVPEAMRRELPVVSATPATVRDVLRQLVRGGQQALIELGLRSRRFVETWHDPAKVAATVIERYRRAVAA